MRRYAVSWSFAAALLVVFVLAGPVWSYGAWEDQESADPWDSLSELDVTVDELDDMVQRAISSRSAHPTFLEDLEDIVQRLKELSAELAEGLPEDSESWSGRHPSTSDVDLAFDFSQVRSLDSGALRSQQGRATLRFDPTELSLQRATRSQRAALVFPDNQHRGADFDADWSQLTEITIAMWVYLDDWGPHARGYARLLVDEEDSGLQVFLHDSGDAAYNRNSLVVTWDGYRVTTETDSLALGDWTHIALVHDGDEIYIYINGSRQSLRRTRGSVQPLNFSQNASYFIGNNPEGSRRLYGRIAELTVWTTSRSAGDIMSEVRSGR